MGGGKANVRKTDASNHGRLSPLPPAPHPQPQGPSWLPVTHEAGECSRGSTVPAWDPPRPLGAGPLCPNGLPEGPPPGRTLSQQGLCVAHTSAAWSTFPAVCSGSSGDIRPQPLCIDNPPAPAQHPPTPPPLLSSCGSQTLPSVISQGGPSFTKPPGAGAGAPHRGSCCRVGKGGSSGHSVPGEAREAPRAAPGG